MLGEHIQERRIEDGIALLEEAREDFAATRPDDERAGLAAGCLAQWVDVGFQDEGMLTALLAKFDQSSRQELPLAQYLHLKMAEALLAMRQEELVTALRHLDAVLALSEETGDRKLVLSATLWKARCLRKAGDYAAALEVTREGMQLAATLNLRRIKAVMQTLESWILFQNSELKEAVRILQEA